MKHWKFWMVVAFSLTIIVVFQNCSPLGDTSTSTNSSLKVTPENSAELQPENVE